MNKLEVRVGEPIETVLAGTAEAMLAIEQGLDVEPYFGIGFETMAQFGEIFTPKRWELVEFLKAAGRFRSTRSPSAWGATIAMGTRM